MPVLEISELGCHLATYRGFITLSVKAEEVKRIPFEHVSSIICKAHGITYSQNLLVKLAKRNIPVVITDSGFMPVSMILPIAAHHAMTKHLMAQIAATKTQKNRLWQSLIKTKVKFQGAVLTQLAITNNLNELVLQVNRGDTRNIEAQAARKYWALLFGAKFKRSPDGFTPNEMLNYGYTVMRSALAREVCATGLHPALGIHHKHRQNAFCLVDDLIEPYRPLVDYAVWHCLAAGEHELNATVKSVLVGLLEQPVKVGKWISVESSMQILAQSLSQSYLHPGKSLKIFKLDLTRLDISIE